jgi:hypothetical protein
MISGKCIEGTNKHCTHRLIVSSSHLSSSYRLILSSSHPLLLPSPSPRPPFHPVLHLPYFHSGIEVALTEGVHHFNPLQARELQEGRFRWVENRRSSCQGCGRGGTCFGTRAVVEEDGAGLTSFPSVRWRLLLFMAKERGLRSVYKNDCGTARGERR